MRIIFHYLPTSGDSVDFSNKTSNVSSDQYIVFLHLETGSPALETISGRAFLISLDVDAFIKESQNISTTEI